MSTEHSRSGQILPLDSPKTLGAAIRAARKRHVNQQTAALEKAHASFDALLHRAFAH